MRRSVRCLHLGRRAKATAPAAVPVEIVQAAQNLRHRLGSESGVGESLMALNAALQRTDPQPSVPPSIMALIGRALDKHANIKGELSGDELQQLFRTTAASNAVQPATKLYMDVYRHAKVSLSDRLANGIEFFRMLRATKHADQANGQISALLRDNAAVVTDETLLTLLEIVSLTASPTNVASAVLSIVQGSQLALPGGPSVGVLVRAVDLLANWGDATSLGALANHVYFANPHFSVDSSIAVVFLDAFLQVSASRRPALALPDLAKPPLPLSSARTTDTAPSKASPSNASSTNMIAPNIGAPSVPEGPRVLNLLLAQIGPEPSLEVCELVLMSIINFQEPPRLGQLVYDQIRKTNNQEYTKETWDVLAQWTAYSTRDLPELLRQIGEVPEHFRDTKTLELVLTASEKAQRSEPEIAAITDYFASDCGVALDASNYEILINRSLRAQEIDRARILFVESNTNWNINNDRHLYVLSDLLVALCRTPSIPRQVVLDTYQRVRVFAPQVSHEAQMALLKMLLQEAEEQSVTPAAVFLIEQFGESPQLPFSQYSEVFYLFYHRILAANTEDDAWSLFGILNCTIILPYEAYYPLQLKLCKLGRPDAAHLLFRQLRNRAKSDGSRPPGDEMYRMLFHEYALARYDEGIHELETYFRVDLNNEMTVPMMNQMLAAYSALDDSHKVSYLWAEAKALPRGGSLGPNNETMCLMLQYFSKHVNLDAVDDLWQTIPSDFRLKLTPSLLEQYVIANCYHGYYTRALEVVKMAPTEYGLPVTPEVLQALYNWTLLPARKAEVREYAIENHASEWGIAESRGLLDVLLPGEDDSGHNDERSRRFAAIAELERSTEIVNR